MIVPYADVTDAMVASAIEGSRDTLRHSVSGVDRVILKFNPLNGIPVEFSGIPKLSHADIILETAESDWADEPEP